VGVTEECQIGAPNRDAVKKQRCMSEQDTGKGTGWICEQAWIIEASVGIVQTDEFDCHGAVVSFDRHKESLVLENDGTP
jgi:hypothetical protein